MRSFIGTVSYQRHTAYELAATYDLLGQPYIHSELFDGCISTSTVITIQGVEKGIKGGGGVASRAERHHALLIKSLRDKSA